MTTAARTSSSTITEFALTIGHRVQFAQTADLWWTVRAVSHDRSLIILTSPNPEGILYMVIDNERRVRSSANVWRNGYEIEKQIAQSLEDLADGEIEASHRPFTWEDIRIAAVLPPSSGAATKCASENETASDGYEFTGEAFDAEQRPEASH